MPEVLACPTCRGEVTVGDELLGGQAVCPHCRNAFVAPMPMPSESEPEPPRPKPKRKKQSGDPFAFDDADEDDRPRRRRRDEDDEEEDDSDKPAAYRRHRKENPFHFNAAVCVVMTITLIVVMALLAVDQMMPKKVGFNMSSTVLMGLVGGVLAAGGGLARVLGTKAANDLGRQKYRKRR